MMNRTLLSNLAFLIGILTGALVMRGWVDGNIPGLDAPSPQVSEADGTPSTPENDSESPVGSDPPTAIPTPTTTPRPTATLAPTPEEIAPDAVSSFPGAESIPGGWKWVYPTRFEQGPITLDDGGFYFITRDHTVYGLNADGSPRLQLTIEDIYRLPNSFTGFQPLEVFGDGTILVKTEERMYAIGPDGSERWSFPVVIPTLPSDAFDPPVPYLISVGDVFMQLDLANTLHVFNLVDGLLWQAQFDSPLRELFSQPVVDEANGQVVFVDEPGHVRAFNIQNGTLNWEYLPEDNLRGASDLVQGLDGMLYYVITSGSTGFLQALSTQGEALWRAELETILFYHLPLITPKGDLAIVYDDIVDTTTHQVVNVEIPFEVDEFIMGEDGETYLRTDTTLIQWQIGPNGFETLNTAPLRVETTNQFFFPFFIRVRAEGIIEVRDFSQNTFAVRWLTLAGESLGAHTGPTLYFTDEAAYYPCTTRQEGSQSYLDCEKFVPGNPDPIWTDSFGPLDAEITMEDGFFYRNGKLFITDENTTLYVVDVQVP